MIILPKKFMLPELNPQTPVTLLYLILTNNGIAQRKNFAQLTNLLNRGRDNPVAICGTIVAQIFCTTCKLVGFEAEAQKLRIAACEYIDGRARRCAQKQGEIESDIHGFLNGVITETKRQLEKNPDLRPHLPLLKQALIKAVSRLTAHGPKGHLGQCITKLTEKPIAV